LAFYQNIDIALDTYPFNGCITTLEALWMGVPVVSRCGPAWVSRLGLSLLSNLDFGKFVASTDEQFIAKAMALAANPDLLVPMRAALRSRLQASPVCNAKRLAGDLDVAYRRMWRTWLGSGKA
jgi:predicted O-linked N-acetylglucosamine transferase (SPINDLY family)